MKAKLLLMTAAAVAAQAAVVAAPAAVVSESPSAEIMESFLRDFSRRQGLHYWNILYPRMPPNKDLLRSKVHLKNFHHFTSFSYNLSCHDER